MLKRAAEIRTERLIMKAFEACDADDMVYMLCNDEIKQTFMIPDFESREAAVKAFERLKELSDSDERFMYGIYREGLLIGFVNDVEIKDGAVELGIVVRPEMKGRGYGTEALNAAMEELFRMGYTSIITGVFEENTGSKRVMRKCGMSLVDRTEEVEYRGRTHHCVYFEKRRQGEEAWTHTNY